MTDNTDAPNLTHLESALNAGGFPALHAAAIHLRDAGLPQDQLRKLFDTLRARHQHDTDEQKYDAIVDVMDYIVGWCSSNKRLYPKTQPPT